MRLPILLIAAGCASGSRPHGGAWDLDATHTLQVEATYAGAGRCDWWSARDHYISSDYGDGFCLATLSLMGTPEARIQFPHEAYEDTTEITYGGVSGETSNLRLTHVGSSGFQDFTVVWGPDGDPSAWQVSSLQLNAARYRP